MNYRQQNRITGQYDGLWWQIALGIFVGQLMIAGLAAVLAFAFGFLALNSISAALPRTSHRTTVRLPTAAPIAPATPRALDAGERCISHKRFKRLSNGWQELPNDPC